MFGVLDCFSISVRNLIRVHAFLAYSLEFHTEPFFIVVYLVLHIFFIHTNVFLFESFSSVSFMLFAIA